MRFTQKLVQLGIATMTLMSQQSQAQSTQDVPPKLDPTLNYVLTNYKGMDVILLREAQIEFTTKNQKDAAPSEVVASGVLFHQGGRPVGGWKNSTGSRAQPFVSPAEPQFNGTNYATNNYVFSKDGANGNFSAQRYMPGMDIQNIAGAVGQSGLMALDDGVVVANQASTNRNERMGVFGNRRDVMVIKCSNCTVAEMGLLAQDLGMTEGGMLDGGQGVTGYTVNTGNEGAITNGTIKSTYNLVVRSSKAGWKKITPTSQQQSQTQASPEKPSIPSRTSQSTQRNAPSREGSSVNQAFKYKGMDVVIMRDAKIGFTQETDNKNISQSDNLIMSGPFQYEDGTFLGGFKFSNTMPNWKVLADPKDERFANTNFATNNFVFYKNGNEGDFVATKYDPALDITKMPFSAVQNGLMGLDDGVNVANRTSTNKNDRTGLFGNKSDIAMIKCDQCTVYQMAEVAKELGMKEGGIVNTGKDAGYSLQVDEVVTKKGNLPKNNIVITSNIRAWQNRLR